jgi:hypothetical protein
MLAMLSTVVIGAAALVLSLLCGALILPLPREQARNLQGFQYLLR